jgi:hypothetical protein
MAHEKLAAQLRPHATGKLTMAQTQPIELVEAAKAGLALDHFDIFSLHNAP